MTDYVPGEDDDLADEGFFAARLSEENSNSYVETGFGLTADHTNEQVDVEAGRARLSWTTADGFGRAKVVERDTTTTVAFATTSGVNEVYVSTRQSTTATGDGPDAIDITCTTGGAPSDPFGDGSATANLLIGTVDAGADTSPEEKNRRPLMSAERLVAAVREVTGSLGAGDGETIRMGGITSDFTFNVQGGHGRVLNAWNARYNQGTGSWEQINGSDPSSAIGYVSTRPGPGTSTGNLVFATAASTGTDGASITWNYIVVDEGGNLDLRNNNIESVGSLNTADIANAASGDVLQSDGAGGLTFGSVSGGQTKLVNGVAVAEDTNGTVNPVSGHKARAYMSSDQSIANSSATQIQYDTETKDETNNYDTSNYQYVTPTAGSYEVDVWLVFDTTDSFNDLSQGEKMYVEVRKNGSTYSIGKVRKSNSSFAESAHVSTSVDCAQGDTLTFFALQNSGASQTLRSGSTQSYVEIT